MIRRQEFIDWLRKSGDLDNLVIAALLEQNLIEMPIFPGRCDPGDRGHEGRK